MGNPDDILFSPCSNSRTILREDLERRVLAGLKERMMAPEVAAAAMRAHAEETNQLNRERRSNGDAWKAELGDQLADIPEDAPDLLPRASAIYAKKVAALTTALARPAERPQATAALRMLIERSCSLPARNAGTLRHAAW